ncbi:MAG: restriction endonuclease subunit S [Chitinophagaceae bacterium]|nr:restriction endonuclease subunit S [Chitinophagaceae bacterium]
MPQFKKYKLGELITHKKGFAFKSKDYSTIGVPIVRVSDLTEDSVDLSNCLHVNKNLVPAYSDYSLKKDDMVITTVGSWQYNPASVVGKIIRVPESANNTLLNQNAVRLRANEKTNQHFIFYRLKCDDFKEYIVTGAQGSANQAAITLEQIFGFEFDLPDLPTQTRIASILSSLDDKIELNRRTNHTLEQIAQTLFKKYFVDDIDPENLPEGWKMDILESMIGELETGGRPKGGVNSYSKGIPSIGAENIVSIGKYDFKKNKFVPEEYFEKMTKGIVKNRDILIYKDGGTPGNFIPHISMFGEGFPFEICCINEHVYRFQTKYTEYQSYAYLWLNSYTALDEMKQKGTGVAIPGLNSTALKSISFLVPSRKKMVEFNKIVEPIFKNILTNSKENFTLSKTRDYLLPKLMSGEIEVNVSEKELVT